METVLASLAFTGLIAAPFLAVVAMRTIGSAPAAQAGSARARGLVAEMKRWRHAYDCRRRERADRAELRAMTDRELHDIGLHRSWIEYVHRKIEPADRCTIESRN